MEQLNEIELEDISGGNWKTDYFIYKVVPGDSVSGLAMRFGTNVNKILWLNRDKITDPDVIRVGWELKIPSGNKPGWM